MLILKKRKLNRKTSFDYSSNHQYYVTIIVEDRRHVLGHVTDKTMYKSPEGEIVEKCWYWLQEQYSYVILHSFIVMPDHVHGIIEINSNNSNQELKIKPLSELIGAFKTTSSRKIHLYGTENFQWKRSFHDHIIKNESEYNQITDYINQNPANWGNHRLH